MEVKKDSWIRLLDLVKQLKGYTLIEDVYVREYDIGGLPRIFNTNNLDEIRLRIKEIIHDNNDMNYIVSENRDDIFISFWNNERDMTLYLIGLDNTLWKQLSDEFIQYTKNKFH